MNSKTYTASRLKAELLGALDGVEASGEPIVVTKRGRPVARIVPFVDDPSLRGSVTFLVDDDELLRPVEVSWDAETA